MSSAPGSDSSRATLHASVDGLVQGVGYRWFVARVANHLGLVGYVRNLSDGTVEVEAEGERQALEQLLAALTEGPPAARVTAVTPTWSACRSAFDRFEIRR